VFETEEVNGEQVLKLPQVQQITHRKPHNQPQQRAHYNGRTKLNGRSCAWELRGISARSRCLSACLPVCLSACLLVYCLLSAVCLPVCLSLTLTMFNPAGGHEPLQGQQPGIVCGGVCNHRGCPNGRGALCLHCPFHCVAAPATPHPAHSGHPSLLFSCERRVSGGCGHPRPNHHVP
jgi:hypothetical protein